MKTLILCGGNGTRWDNFRGTLKHLLTIEGEVLLERTCRQFSEYTDDITIVAEGENYTTGKACVKPPLKGADGWNDLVKLWSSHHLWSDHDRTVLVFGDVYFTDDAVNTIMTDTEGIKFFMRSHPSSFTGKKYREIFAIAFDSSFNDDITNFIRQSLTLPLEHGGWALFDTMKNWVPPPYRNIDDWTEDFDCPIDLENWEQKTYN